MKAKQWLAVALSGTLLLCTGCSGAPDETAEESETTPLGTAVEVTETALGEISTQYALTGKVAAADEIQIFPLLAGQVQTLSVQEGDKVSAGQELLTIDTSTVTSTLGSLQQSYSATQTSTQGSIESAQMGVKNAQSNLEQAKRGVEQAQRAYDQAQRSQEQAQRGVDQAQRNLEQTQATVEQAKRGVESANTAVENAQIAVDQAQEASDNAHALFEAGAAAEQDVTHADQALTQAKAGLESAQRGVLDAQQAVTNAEQGVLSVQEALLSAQDGVKTANEAVQNAAMAKSNAEDGVAAAQRAVEQAQTGVSQARAQQTASLAQVQASIDQINSQASNGRVTAPCSGTVTAVNVKRGGMASSAQPAVVIAENSNIEVSVAVAEDVFTKLHKGDTASVLITSVSDEPIDGHIDDLPVTANAQTNLYDISVILSGGATPPIGSFATVTFYTDRRENILHIPTEAILTGDNEERYVFVVADEAGTTVNKVTIEPGLANDTDTEILSGLNAGDKVVVKGQSYLSDGSNIRIVSGESGLSSDVAAENPTEEQPAEADQSADTALVNDNAASDGGED